MQIESVAYTHSHTANYIIERPTGVGCWFFLVVKSPCWFMFGEKKQLCKKGTAVLFSADVPCSYGADGGEFVEDWFYASHEDGDEAMLEKLGIPVNTPIFLGNTEEFSQIIHVIVCEHYSAGEYRREIVRKYLEVLLMKLSRISKDDGYYSPAIFTDKNVKLTHLRTRMYDMPSTIPDVTGMAKEVGMSRSGLQHLYKRYFGISITTDVINGRIEYSKRLLSVTGLPLEEIAEQCGYGSVCHFINQFKTICGKTPTQYRNGS